MYHPQMQLAGRALAIFSIAVFIVVAWAYTLGKLTILRFDGALVVYQLRDVNGTEKATSEEIFDFLPVVTIVGQRQFEFQRKPNSKLASRVFDITKLPRSLFRSTRGKNSHVTIVRLLPKGQTKMTLGELFSSPFAYYGPHGERLEPQRMIHHWQILILGQGIDMRMLLGLAVVAASILALVLGTMLGIDADLRLALAKTRPVSATSYAAATHAINGAAVALAATVAFAGLIALPLIHTDFYSGSVSAAHALALLASVVLAGLAWYALTAALTTTRRVLPGVIVLAVAWSIAFFMAAEPNYVVLGPFEIARGLINALNPFWHVETLKAALIPNSSWDFSSSSPATQPSQIVPALAALLEIGLVGVLVSIFRWRRIEA